MDIFAGGGFWGMISGATIVVKLVMIILVFMSLTSWTIIFFKFIVLSAAKRRSERELRSFVNADNLAMAIQVLKQSPRSNLYEVGAQGLAELKRLERAALPSTARMRTAMDTLRRVLRRAVNDEMGKLSSSLSFLATCSNAAPFIGLFGTVWGIMHSFHAIGLQKSAALTTVAPGISEALVATAIGLAVAIPATIAYNYFMGMLTRVESDLVNFAGAFLNRVQRELPAGHAGSREK
jgi:biopolymer transport protein TolQ